MSRLKRPTAGGPPAPTIADYAAAFCAAPLTRKAVNDLSSMLAQVVGTQLMVHLPGFPVTVGHRSFGGSVRRHHLDVWIANEHLGLQLGIDVKGLNSSASAGKNWNNRVGDLHELASNHHQVFPKAVLGGVLAIPFEGLTPGTLNNIERSMFNIGGRRALANAHNQLECSSLLVISKERLEIIPNLPSPDSPLRFERFASTMAEIFRQRWR